MTSENHRQTHDLGLRSGKFWRPCAVATLAAALLMPCAVASASSLGTAFIPAQGATSPANGDLNPYGLAVVPFGFPLGGKINPGQLLVSNFNNSANLQGQGHSIVIIDPNTGQQVGTFFTTNINVGFTNALAVLRAGFVLGGSVFTKGTSTAAFSGGLWVFDRNGNLVTRIGSLVGGPWGLAVNEQATMAQLFVSNVLTGTIQRENVSLTGGKLTVASTTTIATGYAHGADKAALVVGPAGLVYDPLTDTLYVAAEDDNEVFAVPHAGMLTSPVVKGTLVYQDNKHLHGPLGLMVAPDGNFVTANADPTAHNDPTMPSELVEFTLRGQFVREFSIDSNPGSAFAILNVPGFGANQFAYVDDTTSTLTILQLTPF